MGRKKIYKTDAQKKKAKTRWTIKSQKKTMKGITIRLHKEHDKSVLEHLEKQTNKTDYLRQLILNDMNKTTKE